MIICPEWLWYFLETLTTKRQTVETGRTSTWRWWGKSPKVGGVSHKWGRTMAGWWLTYIPLWKIWKSINWDDYSQYMENQKNNPNHQPDGDANQLQFLDHDIPISRLVNIGDIALLTSHQPMTCIYPLFWLLNSLSLIFTNVVYTKDFMCELIQ